MDRRQLLGWAAAGTSTLWLPRSAWSQPKLQDNPFALGVASGSPTHNSVVLWTRLVTEQAPSLGPVTVRWEVAHDAEFRRPVQSGQAQALPALAHSVHVEVQGLEPDRWYHYRFMLGAAVSMVGRTRTFPAPDAAAHRLRLGYASCQHWEHGHYSAYRHMQAEQLDALMFLGDYIYEYGGSSQAVRTVPLATTLTLDDYRARYALYKSDPHLQAMHADCPWLLTWDDHEVQNDYASSTQGSRGPEGIDFAARRAAAYQAYYEHMPLRAAALGRALNGVWGAKRELRLYDRVPFGRLATLHLLDDRQYRDPHACTKGGGPGSSTVNPASCAALADPRRTLLGAAQERWLEQSLAAGGGQWTVLGQQTVFGQRDFKPGEGRSVSNDGWDGYAAARTRVTDALQHHQVSNPVFLGGDVHSNWVGHVKADYARPQSKAVGVEFCGTSITSRGGSNDGLPETLAENPHFVFADRERRGYGVAEFTPKGLSVTLRAVDDVTRPDSGVQTLATFAVEPGQAVVHRA
ncbi:MAG: alkaline phosphatase [Curvibacter sp. RIFCSPHIGHO2_12_FULL_63_18]|uniref:alkaline phosphatase D family protein n=1 Tax=Rhodoferax sp. TaxID=50421 RepID=UPI0008D5DB1A|nr:alkaline phosphatase D family protein [Rhodoferax sp.]OGO96987.1 MAG: alkaline phosphatase [Curvibacter sp. GWA2_63_95]OGP01164.1 MAG: alkaline phosphatase [Curvibacter sp. RIFCSPHIGHO2_12_FULL_63_18]HCX79972.1 alkaline phosphatase [Rhodoferax sp.]